MIKIIVCLLVSASCSLLQKDQFDPLDSLISIHKHGKLPSLVSTFGEPDRIEITNEKGLPLKNHSGNEYYEVRIPRLGLEFEYGKHSPKIL